MAERPTSITVFSVINLIILGICGIFFLVGFFALFANFDIVQFIFSLIMLGITTLFIIGMIKGIQLKKFGFVTSLIYAFIGGIGSTIGTIVALIATVTTSSAVSAIGSASGSAAAREAASGVSGTFAALGAIMIIFLAAIVVYYVFNIKVLFKHKAKFN